MQFSIKPGVKISNMKPQTVLGLLAAYDVFRNANLDLVLTSAMEGNHKTNSLHYAGLAFDIRNHHIPEISRKFIVARLKEVLGPEYDVVPEETHIHIEFDPKL